MGQHTSRDKKLSKAFSASSIGPTSKGGPITRGGSRIDRDTSLTSLNSRTTATTPSIGSTPVKKKKTNNNKKTKLSAKPTLRELEEQSKARELQERLDSLQQQQQQSQQSFPPHPSPSTANTDPTSRRDSLPLPQASHLLYDPSRGPSQPNEGSPSLRPQPLPQIHPPLLTSLPPSANYNNQQGIIGASAAVVAPHTLEKTVVAGVPVGAYPIVRPPSDNSSPFEAPLDHIREEERPFHHLSTITHFDVTTLRKLHLIFTEISESQVDDGIIDANELTHAMGLKPTCLLARAIFKIFDITATKKINFRTWVTTLSALSVKAGIDEKIRFSFSLYDLNGDGCIDLNELRDLLEAAVRENVLNLSEEQVKSICDFTLQSVDKDKNGSVDYAEYKAMVEKSAKFLDSFTLDINQLCGSFRFNSKAKGGEDARISEQEAGKKAQLFRQRQKHFTSDSDEQILANNNGQTAGGGKVPVNIKSPPELLRQFSTESTRGDDGGDGGGAVGSGGGNVAAGEDVVRPVSKLADLSAELNFDL